MKKWTTAMDDSEPDHESEYPSPPNPGEFHPQNCRCTFLIMSDVPWIIEVRWIMDEIFGDTSPRLPEFQREYKGIFHA